ncbi:uracil-DNA glycosylase [Stratiformator vulcanicus]|uniref:Type-4 uracil-DNA glycosylase n=1 Tax=Stratiformator vulcanicus TaxID=2527980 RepID=A0A517QYQ0_9PLAN|nr:uracil-DNA glycosylase [Stratiformator vulcanicus]QDT36762.1 Uracil DNA glycosylase superfamily protein [Stratiformator vulcanicus]
MDIVTLRRMLRKRLEADRRAGLTHLPRSEAFDLTFLTAVAKYDDAEKDAAAKVDGKKKPTSTKPQPSVIATNVEVELPTESYPRDERIRRLTTLAKKVSRCTRCQELAETRTQTVFGVGDPEAAIMFIGEAPGADEDREGEPFVGRAGQLLNKIIGACRMKREEIYICNILRCRPPGNRNPSETEAANCREYLDAQIALVRPDYIVCWGSVAAKSLLGASQPIGKMRRQFFEYGEAKVACTYHPSYLLRNPPAKKDVWEDMKWLFKDMGVDLDS